MSERFVNSSIAHCRKPTAAAGTESSFRRQPVRYFTGNGRRRRFRLRLDRRHDRFPDLRRNLPRRRQTANQIEIQLQLHTAGARRKLRKFAAEQQGQVRVIRPGMFALRRPLPGQFTRLIERIDARQPELKILPGGAVAGDLFLVPRFLLFLTAGQVVIVPIGECVQSRFAGLLSAPPAPPPSVRIAEAQRKRCPWRVRRRSAFPGLTKLGKCQAGTPDLRDTGSQLLSIKSGFLLHKLAQYLLAVPS